MHIDSLLAEARKIWGDTHMSLDHIAVAMGVVYGDICRQARNNKEGVLIDKAELKKELGNIITSTIRWCDDLGFDPKDCIVLAQEAQSAYVQKAKL